MNLHWSPRSPFVRKVMVAAHELGLTGQLRQVRTVAGMAQTPPALLADNPLGKIPALVLADGTVLYDSFVIIDHLDTLAGGGLMVPRDAGARQLELRRHARRLFLGRDWLFLRRRCGLNRCDPNPDQRRSNQYH